MEFSSLLEIKPAPLIAKRMPRLYFRTPPLRQSRDRDMILSKGAALWKGHSKPKNRLSASGQGAGPGFGGLPRAFPAVPGGLSRVPSGRHLQCGLQRHLHSVPGVRPAPVRRKSCPTKSLSDEAAKGLPTAGGQGGEKGPFPGRGGRGRLLAHRVQPGAAGRLAGK